MSLQPPLIQYGKRCLVYCGDERCNCNCNPRYWRYRNTYSFSRNHTPEIKKPESEQISAMIMEKS